MYVNLAQATSVSDAEAQYRDLVEKIQEQLRRKFSGPNDPRLYTRRLELRRLFNQIPANFAQSLHQKLVNKGDPLAKDFNRLSSIAQKELLGILRTKSSVSAQPSITQPAQECATPVEQYEGRCILAKERWQTYQAQANDGSAKPWHYFLTKDEYLRFRLKQRAQAWKAERKKEQADLKRAIGFDSILYSADSLRLERRGHPMTAAILKLIRQMLVAGEVRKSRSEATEISKGLYAVLRDIKRVLQNLRPRAPIQYTFDAEMMVIGTFLNTIELTALRIRTGASYTKGWEGHWFRQLKSLDVGLIRIMSPAASRTPTRIYRPNGAVSHKLFITAAFTPGAILVFYLNLELKHQGDIPGAEVVLKEGGPEVSFTGKPGGPSATVSGTGLNSTLTIEGAKEWSGTLAMSSGGDLNYSLKNSDFNFSVSGKLNKAALTAQLPELKLGEHFIVKAEPEIEVTLLPMFWRRTQTQSPQSIRAFRKAAMLSPATWLVVAPLVIGLGALVVEAGAAAAAVGVLKHAPGVIIRLAPAI